MRDPTRTPKPRAQPAAPAAPAAAPPATTVGVSAPPVTPTAAPGFTHPSPLTGQPVPPARPAAAAPAALAATTDATATPAAPAVATADPTAASDRMKTAAATISKIRRSGAFVGGLGVGGLRLLMPVLGAYAGPQPKGTDDTRDTTEPAGNAARLSRRESAVLTAAAGKALLELVEITSRTDPITGDATPYVAYDDGVFRPPHLMHLLSLASAANRVLGGKNDNDGEDQPPPSPAIDATHSVAYVARAPGEYVREPGPLTPTAMRRSAMRERTYNAPQLAMLARGSNQFQTAPATSGSTGTSMAMMRATAGPNYNSQAYGMTAHGAQPSHGVAAHQGHAAGGCGCGGGGCGGSCGCTSCGGQTQYQFSPARRDADGKCVSIFNISCDTGWRIRECLKFSLCDFIRCVGDEVCEDGKFAPNPDLKACLEGLVCSLLTCLPEAICPAPTPVRTCPPALPDDCNYASGRWAR